MTHKRLLNVGCGPRGHNHGMSGFDGWVETRLDIDPSLQPDVVGSMTDMSAIASASVDAIVSSHNIEHLSPHQVPLALSEFLRVLTADGIGVITCPDLQSVAARVAQGELLSPLYESSAGPIAALDVLYGLRGAMAAGKDFMAHRCGFTLPVLIDLLLSAGFARAVGMVRPEAFDLWVVASKSPCSDDALHALAARHLPPPAPTASSTIAALSARELQALQNAPTDAASLAELGERAGLAGRHALAEHYFRQACLAEPASPIFLHNHGEALRQLNQLPQAEQCFRKVIALNPGFAPAYTSLIQLVQVEHTASLQQRDPKRSAALTHEMAVLANNQGNAWLDAGQDAKAIACYRQALAFDSRHASAWSNLGNVLRSSGLIGEAEDACRQAIALDPGLAPAWINLGHALAELGRYDEAPACYNQAQHLEPGFAEARRNRLFNTLYRPEFSPAQILAQHKAWGAHHPAPAAPASAPTLAHPFGKTLRIGYLSPDFREHSMLHFLEPMLVHHDPAQVSVTCYSECPRSDDHTRRLMSYGHTWVFTHGLDDAALAHRIRQDGIDILVDCAGHTLGTRLDALAGKPAAILMSWLGYLGTTGLPAMDYRLTDDWVDPVGLTESQHTETLLRIPGGMLAYRPHAAAPDVAPPPVARTGRVTFGSLNKVQKLNAVVIELWAAVLHAVPESRLLLKSKIFADSFTRGRISGLFEAFGIRPGRLELRGASTDYLATYHEIDIALDTTPFGGGATTCDALWMGVPVITLSGERSAGRLTTSILNLLGHSEWVADSREAYIQIACSLASNTDHLAGIRSELREQMQTSRLCDEAGFTRRLEALYRQVVRH
jgi:protein O-GlcNAc transferase